MVSKIPEIEGANTLLDCPFISSVISEKKNMYHFDFKGLQFNYLSEKLNEEKVNKWYRYIAHNFNNEWSFMNDESIAHNFMVWRLRSSQDCVTIPMILKEFCCNCAPPQKNIAQILDKHQMLVKKTKPKP